MTEFLDVLETQLDAAARRRYAPRRAPRRLFGEIAVAAVAVAAIALAVIVLGGRGETHSARTPTSAAGATTLAARVGDAGVVVLNATTRPGAAGALASRLTRAGVHVVRVGDDADRYSLEDTDVRYAPGAAGAALAVSELLTGIPQRLAALRVAPLDASTTAMAGPAAQVVVRVGRDDLVTPVGTAPVRFRDGFHDGCPSNLGDPVVGGAPESVLLAWPEADRAVLAGARPAYRSGWRKRIEQLCGPDAVASTMVVDLELTAHIGAAAKVTLFVACNDGGWVVWRSLRR
jgi:hypothetical protein